MYRFLKSVYVNTIIRNAAIAKLFPFKKPVILLLANPRSGSSWVGRVLSYLPDVAYLREPVTQTIIRRLDLPPAAVDPQKSEENFDLLKRYSDKAFSGVPTVTDGIGSLDDFTPFVRVEKNLLIKEVNVRAADFFIEQYAPKVILLLRHPAGIADSYMRLGWIENDFEEFAYSYGKSMAEAIKAISKVSSRIQLYEEIAMEPKAEYRKLYEFMGVNKPENFNQLIAEYSKRDNYEWNPYQSKRQSDEEAYKWKNNLSAKTIDAIKTGFMRSGLDFYREDEYWYI